MPVVLALTPKKRAALSDCAASTLRRCNGGYAIRTGADVHTKRVVNQLAADGLVTVSEFETEVQITALGRDVAQIHGLAAAA